MAPCPACNSFYEVLSDGEYVCGSCGLVLGQSYVGDGIPCDYGFDEQMFEDPNELATLPPEIGGKARPTREKYLKNIADLGDKLHLTSNMIQEAKRLFKRFYEANQGKSRKWFITGAASLVLAMRKQGSGLGIDDVSCASGQKSKAIWKEMDRIKAALLVQTVPAGTSASEMRHNFSKFTPSYKIQRTAVRIAQNIDKHLNGTLPHYRDGIALYLATQLTDSKCEVKVIAAELKLKVPTFNKLYVRAHGQLAKLFQGCDSEFRSRIGELSPTPV